MLKTRRYFDSSFKEKAVELSYARGSVVEVAAELGISKSILGRWRREHKAYAQNSFPGKGIAKMTDSERENARLRCELADVTMERDILKKAISIFSVSDKKSTRS